NMGVRTVELSLANLVHCFEWKLPNGFDKEQVLDTQVKSGIVMHKKIDLYLVPRKRKP
ncbi:cytochrome P450 83B1-like, partial [Trifolium medium]|nr:cytochrome P450 83B1-like [Trifolium medium]